MVISAAEVRVAVGWRGKSERFEWGVGSGRDAVEEGEVECGWEMRSGRLKAGRGLGTEMSLFAYASPPLKLGTSRVFGQ